MINVMSDRRRRQGIYFFALAIMISLLKRLAWSDFFIEMTFSSLHWSQISV
jgi:hypothetical protein